MPNPERDVSSLDAHRHNRRPSPAATDRHRETSLFAAEVRRAIDAKGCSLRELQKLLDRYGPLRSSVGTLSSWQNGTSVAPSNQTGLDRVLALERCLDVPAGDLATLIPGDLLPAITRPMSRAAWRERSSTATLDQRHTQFRAIVNRLSGPQQTIPVSTDKTYVLGRGFRPGQTAITTTLRAAHDHVDRYWFIHAPGVDVAPNVARGDGCNIGRILSEEDVMPDTFGRDGETVRFNAVELLFDRVLLRRERYKFTFSVAYTGEASPANGAEDLFRHFQKQPCERLDLTLHFQGCEPEQVQTCVWEQRDERLIGSSTPDKDPRGLYHQLITDPAPGGYGWQWTRPAAIVSTRGGAPAGNFAA